MVGRSFERLLAEIESVVTPSAEKERAVVWLDDAKNIGVARNSSGAYEIFLPGDRLVALSSLVERHLQFNEWKDASESKFVATRIVLPAEPHFGPVAAFLAEELFRNGLGVSRTQVAFRLSEPLVEMALRRASLSEPAIVGLIGELRVLGLLLSVAHTPKSRAEVVESWRGYERSTYDFVFGMTAVEVKTVVGVDSNHEISSIGQVDPPRDLEGAPSIQLFLLSQGLSHPPTDAGPGTTFTLRDCVEFVLGKLGSRAPYNEIQELFLDKLRRYGENTGRGYDYETMNEWGVYAVPYVHAFYRIYDMNDPAMLVLRREQLLGTFVVPESTSFKVNLPEKVTGDLNPRSDMAEWAKSLLK